VEVKQTVPKSVSQHRRAVLVYEVSSSARHVSSIQGASPHNHHCTYLLTDDQLNILCVP